MELSRLKLRLVRSYDAGLGGLDICLEIKEDAYPGERARRVAVAQTNFARAFELLEKLMIALRLAAGPVDELNALMGRADHWLRTSVGGSSDLEPAAPDNSAKDDHTGKTDRLISASEVEQVSAN